MAESYTIAELAEALRFVVDGMRSGEIGEDRVYNLHEVAERTGFAHRQLVLDCRANLLEHVHRGDFRGMTSRQITLLVKRHAQGGDLAHRAKHPSADLESGRAQALAMTRESGAKRAAPRKQRDAAA